MSEVITRHEQHVAKHPAASLASVEITDQLWLLSQLPGNTWMFILSFAHMLHQRPKLLVLSTFQSKQSLGTLFLPRQCVPFNAIFHECTTYSADIESVIFHFPQMRPRSPHSAEFYFI